MGAVRDHNLSVGAWLQSLSWRCLRRNYGPTIAVQSEASKRGCQQVLWLYGEDEEVTEVGTMNFFVYWTKQNGGRTLSTPALSLNRCSAEMVSPFVIPHREGAGDSRSGRPHPPRSDQAVPAGPGSRLGKTIKPTAVSHRDPESPFCATRGSLK